MIVRSIKSSILVAIVLLGGCTHVKQLAFGANTEVGYCSITANVRDDPTTAVFGKTELNKETLKVVYREDQTPLTKLKRKVSGSSAPYTSVHNKCGVMTKLDSGEFALRIYDSCQDQGRSTMTQVVGKTPLAVLQLVDVYMTYGMGAVRALGRCPDVSIIPLRG